MRFVILSLGYDSHLMHIRTLLLQRHGYQVEEAYSCSEALGVFSQHSIDLLVICHSVPADEQERLIAEVKSIQPDLPVLCLALPNISLDAIGCTPACSTAPMFLEDVSKALPKRRLA